MRRRFRGRIMYRILAFALLGGCAMAWPTWPPFGPPPRALAEKLTPITLTAVQVETVKDGLRRVLRDPESIQLGKLVAGRSDKGAIAVCGWVNAKNGFGGYTGERPFSGMMTEDAEHKTVFSPIGYDS